jgi:hypothetical protein
VFVCLQKYKAEPHPGEIITTMAPEKVTPEKKSETIATLVTGLIKLTNSDNNFRFRRTKE